MSGRHPPLSANEIDRLFFVDADSGRVFWKNVAKEHARLNGSEAGSKRANATGKTYWVIKVGKKAYRRSQIVLAHASGRWPTDCVDHINGDSLDDRASNLRHATVHQNAMNHKRRKKLSPTPMGVRLMSSGRFQARLAKKCLGTFETQEQAHAVYVAARRNLYGEFA